MLTRRTRQGSQRVMDRAGAGAVLVCSVAGLAGVALMAVSMTALLSERAAERIPSVSLVQLETAWAGNWAVRSEAEEPPAEGPAPEETKREEEAREETKRAPDESKPEPAPVPLPGPEPGPGELVIVKLASGPSFSGLLLESSSDVVVIDTAGLQIRLRRNDIVSIEPKPTRYDEYARLRAVIADDDLGGIGTLVRWLLEHEMFDEAIAEAQALVGVRVGDSDAVRLLRETEAVVRLRQRETSSQNTPGGANRPSGAGERRRDQLASEIESLRFDEIEFPVLTRDQINRIKVLEVDTRNPPRLRITQDTISRLFIEYAGHPLVPESQRARDAFRRKPAAEVLDVMFRVQARSLYGEVQVLGSPEAMERFREAVHARWLINSCASSRCHGGKGAGRFVLRNRRSGSDETMYTNFLIIDRYRTAQGLPLINWSDPARSVLLHYALPRGDALFAHPDVPGFKPPISSRSHRNFQDAVDWLRKMYMPRPDYGIEYESPTELAERLARERVEGPIPEAPKPEAPKPGEPR